MQNVMHFVHRFYLLICTSLVSFFLFAIMVSCFLLRVLLLCIVCRVSSKRPVHEFTLNMFATLAKAFFLPSYVRGLAQVLKHRLKFLVSLAVTKGELNFLNVEAKHRRIKMIVVVPAIVEALRCGHFHSTCFDLIWFLYTLLVLI